MSLTVLTDVMWGGPDDATDHKVLMLLASFSNEDGQSCYPSIELLAQLSRLKERTIIRAIKSLVAGHWLKILAKGDGRGNITAYEVETERLAHRAREKREEWKRKRPKRVTLTTFVQGKGDSDDKERVTLTTRKGDSDDSLIRKKVFEPKARENARATPALAKPPREPTGNPPLPDRLDDPELDAILQRMKADAPDLKWQEIDRVVAALQEQEKLHGRKVASPYAN